MVAAPLLGRVADSLDIVAIRVAYERPVVGWVVLRPETRLVQHRRARRGSRGEERADGRPIGCLKGDVDFSVRLACRQRSQPEGRSASHAVADDVAKNHHPGTAQWREYRVVEGTAGADVGALNCQVVKHAAIITRGRASLVYSFTAPKVRPRTR